VYIVLFLTKLIRTALICSNVTAHGTSWHGTTSVLAYEHNRRQIRELRHEKDILNLALTTMAQREYVSSDHVGVTNVETFCF